MTVNELINRLQATQAMWAMNWSGAKSEADEVEIAYAEGRMLGYGEVIGWIYDEGLEI